MVDFAVHHRPQDGDTPSPFWAPVDVEQDPLGGIRVCIDRDWAVRAAANAKRGTR